MKQTAVEQFNDEILIHLNFDQRLYLKDIFNQAKEMEKQQIIDSFEQADMVGRASIIREINPTDKVVLKYPEISAEQYYNETFKTE